MFIPSLRRYVHVALPLPVFQPYTYAVPETLGDRAVAGARVVVPVRRRELVGIVTADEVEAPGVEAREILAAPDAEPALAASLLRTAEWMAGYYGAPIGLALKAMLPASLWGESTVVLRLLGESQTGTEDSGRGGVYPARLGRGGAGATGGVAGELLAWLERRGGQAPIGTALRALRRPLWEVAGRLARSGALELAIHPPRTEGNRASTRVARLTGPRLTLLQREEAFVRRPRQRALYETLEQFDGGGGATVAHLTQRLGFGPGVLRALAQARLAEIVAVDRERDPFAGEPGTPPPAEATPAQRDAIAAIEALGPGEGALLFGVTGSGKTLVYLEVIRRALATGRGAIILVPEISLTPQTVSRVRGMFGDRVAVLHSGLSDGERADAWRALRRGDRSVAVGPRSAVFAPVERLGFIVVDEEHEASYKNGEAPRYHAREVARVRCRLEGARLLLGSATPALETAAATPERLRLIRLPERVGARPLPPVELVDLRVAPRVPEVRELPWSEALDAALRRTLARGEQALLLLNRRGYAAFLQCPGCGAVRMCSRCSISLTVHRAPPLLKCHYCGIQEPLSSECPACGKPLARAHGIGTQQLELAVAERHPGARVARMDLDTTGTKWSHHRILDRVGRGEVDVLLGTQMIAKGIDFPNVTLVGVVDADTALHLPVFRAAERTFQLLTQVAGRAGRGPKGGRVLVQTRSPEHPALRFAERHDTEGFWAAERASRQDPPYPPELALVNVLVSGADEPEVAAECARLAEWLDALGRRAGTGVVVLGPAPCPVARIKDRWRWHALIKGPGEALGRIVRYAAPRLRRRRDLAVVLDRDPVALL